MEKNGRRILNSFCECIQTSVMVSAVELHENRREATGLGGCLHASISSFLPASEYECTTGVTNESLESPIYLYLIIYVLYIIDILPSGHRYRRIFYGLVHYYLNCKSIQMIFILKVRAGECVFLL